MIATTEVPFELAGGRQPLIIVPAHVNGQGPFPFVLDTGAGISCLSTALANRLEIRAEATEQGMGAAGHIDVGLGRAQSIAVGGTSRLDLQVAISDELERISAAIRAKLDGNIGHNFLNTQRLGVDYARQIIELSPSDGLPPPAGTAAISFQLAHPDQPLIIVSVRVNGTGPYSFLLDTGASTSVVSPDLARAAGIATVAIPPITGAGGTIPAAAGTAQSLEIGDIHREGVRVVVADFLAMISKFFGAPIDGIVGHNVLKEFRLTIDFPGGWLALE